MTERVRHRATYRFDGHTWIAVFPDVGISTFGRTLAAAKEHARSALRGRVAADTRQAARQLRRVGLSTRDVGDILGISSARVAQIEREAPPS